MTDVQPARERRVRLPGLAIATLVLLVLAVGSLAPAVNTALAERQRIADTRARIAGQRAELSRLDTQIARWNDPAYVRAEAGSRLFFVVPGERTYRVVGTVPTTPRTAAPSSTAQPETGDWAAAVLQSVVSAGRTG